MTFFGKIKWRDNMEKKGNKFITLLYTISIVIGVLAAVVTAILNFLKIWQEKDITAIFITLTIAYLFCIVAAIFFFIDKIKEAGLHRVSIVFVFIAVMVVTIFFSGWIGILLGSLNSSPIIIDDMENITIWNTFTYGNGSYIKIKSVAGKIGKAMEIEFNLPKEDNFVAFHRTINPEILFGSKGIGFTYKGTGAANTIEFKLTCKNKQGKAASYRTIRNKVTNTNDWSFIEIPYSQLVCFLDCEEGDHVNISDVCKIDIAISNKTGDMLGAGAILLDDIVGVK
jgi:hypothetical protein